MLSRLKENTENTYANKFGSENVNINSDFLTEYSYSKIDHFKKFREKNIDIIIYDSELDHINCDVKKISEYADIQFYNRKR